jgi:hypothetical protein
MASRRSVLDLESQNSISVSGSERSRIDSLRLSSAGGRSMAIAQVYRMCPSDPSGKSDSRSTPNGLELSCPAEAGNSPLLYGLLAGRTRTSYGPARRVSFSELLGSPDSVPAEN